MLAKVSKKIKTEQNKTKSNKKKQIKIEQMKIKINISFNLWFEFTYLVSLKGTVSGVANDFPCSRTMPKSIWTSSPVTVSIKIFCACLSPMPIYAREKENRRKKNDIQTR